MQRRRQLGHPYEYIRIPSALAPTGDNEVVSGILTFHAYLAADIPHGWMKEQHRLDEPLKQVHNEVESTNMG
jgi:hypothetical protein